MKVSDINNNENFTLLTPDVSLDKDVDKLFCCDLLSIAMGKAPAGSCWVTVMSNVNTLAVATLTDVSCIVLAEGVTMDDTLKAKATSEDVVVFTTELPIYDAAKLIDSLR